MATTSATIGAAESAAPATEMTVARPGNELMSLYRIESDLVELMAALDEAEDEETKRAIEQGIEEYLGREVRKVDHIRGYLRYCETMIAASRLAASEATQMSRIWQNRYEHLKERTQRTMEGFQVKALEGQAGKLLVKRNGGVEPLDLYNEELLPDEYRTATIEMPLTQWKAIQAVVPGAPEAKRAEPDTKRIRAALATPCWLCNAKGGECQECGGTGRTTVAGARLNERGSHLEIR